MAIETFRLADSRVARNVAKIFFRGGNDQLADSGDGQVMRKACAEAEPSLGHMSPMASCHRAKHRTAQALARYTANLVNSSSVG
jgi:hypothetical protein